MQLNDPGLLYSSNYQNRANRRSVYTWWESISDECNRFFEGITAISIHTPPDRYAEILIQLEMARYGVETKPCPAHALNAQRQLLKVMTSVIMGFTAALGGSQEGVSFYTRKAIRSLQQFDLFIHKLVQPDD